jgi:hypothetical protein
LDRLRIRLQKYYKLNYEYLKKTLLLLICFSVNYVFQDLAYRSNLMQSFLNFINIKVFINVDLFIKNIHLEYRQNIFIYITLFIYEFYFDYFLI